MPPRDTLNVCHLALKLLSNAKESVAWKKLLAL